MKPYDFLTYKKYILCNTVDDIEELLNVKYSNHRKKVFYKDISVDADICYFGDSWTDIAGILPEQSWTNQLDILLGITNTNNFGIKGIGIEDILYLFFCNVIHFIIANLLFNNHISLTLIELFPSISCVVDLIVSDTLPVLHICPPRCFCYIYLQS